MKSMFLFSQGKDDGQQLLVRVSILHCIYVMNFQSFIVQCMYLNALLVLAVISYLQSINGSKENTLYHHKGSNIFFKYFDNGKALIPKHSL